VLVIAAVWLMLLVIAATSHCPPPLGDEDL
jgi:hypothetical protein